MALFIDRVIHDKAFFTEISTGHNCLRAEVPCLQDLETSELYWNISIYFTC